MPETTGPEIQRSPSGYAMADNALFRKLAELGKWYRNYMGTISLVGVLFLAILVVPVILLLDNGMYFIAIIIPVIGIGVAVARYRYGWLEVRTRFRIVTRRRKDIGFVGQGGLKIYRYWISDEAAMDRRIKENLQKKTWGEVVETPSEIRTNLLPRKPGRIV